MDYEKAAWKALRVVLPGKLIQGCNFHWTQAVWKKIEKVGLASAIHRFLRKLMALPYLPKEHIKGAFLKLASEASDCVKPVVKYVGKYWINSDLWSPEDWTVFGQAIRTNNDCEGWHRRINGKCGKSSVPFYLLVPLLHREAKLVSINERLVRAGNLKRFQRKKYASMQCKIFKLWEEYEQGSISTSRLLRKCSELNAPVDS